MDFGGSKEVVYERTDYPPAKLAKMFQHDTFSVVGYGTQGRAQSLNMRDNHLNVIVGVRKDGPSWHKALADDWQPGKNLFAMDEAMQRGTVIMNLLSDAGQKQ